MCIRDSYEVVRHKTDYKYAQNMLFPRMYSDAHAQADEDWLGGIKGVQVPYDQCGQLSLIHILGVTVVPINPLSYEWREEMINVANALAK